MLLPSSKGKVAGRFAEVPMCVCCFRVLNLHQAGPPDPLEWLDVEPPLLQQAQAWRAVESLCRILEECICECVLEGGKGFDV